MPVSLAVVYLVPRLLAIISFPTGYPPDYRTHVFDPGIRYFLTKLEIIPYGLPFFPVSKITTRIYSPCLANYFLDTENKYSTRNPPEVLNEHTTLEYYETKTILLKLSPHIPIDVF